MAYSFMFAVEHFDSLFINEAEHRRLNFTLINKGDRRVMALF